MIKIKKILVLSFVIIIVFVILFPHISFASWGSRIARTWSPVADTINRAVDTVVNFVKDFTKSLFPDLITYEYKPSPQGSYSVSISAPSKESFNASSMTETLKSTLIIDDGLGNATSTTSSSTISKKVRQIKYKNERNIEYIITADGISRSFIRLLNSDIIALSIPNCMIKYTTKQISKKIDAEVTCDTYALSADGRVGTARYYRKDSSSDWGALGALGTINAFINNMNGNPINVKENMQSLSAPTIYGTVENSNNLGLGTWTWPGALLPVPTVNLRKISSQYEISKPNNLASIGLDWSSSNTNSCLASGDWAGSKPLNGSESLLKPRGSYNFTLTCLGSSGSASSTVSTTVIQVPQCSFSAASSTIVLPQTTTISWDCDYSTSCSINQGVGLVNNNSGSITVRPTQNTTYALSCDGLDGSKDFNTSVNIKSPLKIRYKEVIPR